MVAEPVEKLLTDAVLTRLDSPHLAKVLAGKSSTDRDVAELAAAVEADQARLGELAALYAEGAVTAREWIAARDPIAVRIGQNRREIAAATDTTAVYELASTGGILREQWPDMDLGRKQAIVKGQSRAGSCGDRPRHPRCTQLGYQPRPTPLAHLGFRHCECSLANAECVSSLASCQDHAARGRTEVRALRAHQPRHQKRSCRQGKRLW